MVLSLYRAPGGKRGKGHLPLRKSGNKISQEAKVVHGISDPKIPQGTEAAVALLADPSNHFHGQGVQKLLIQGERRAGVIWAASDAVHLPVNSNCSALFAVICAGGKHVHSRTLRKTNDATRGSGSLHISGMEVG